MSSRAQTGKLRRELRFSKCRVETNLDLLGKELSSVRPLVDAFMTNDGLLALYGTELLLLEKALGIGFGSPAFDLVGELISVKAVPANTKVSYGYLGKTAKSSNLGLVGIGFSDGIPREASNLASLSIAGVAYPILGRIAMDQLVIDLGDTSPELGSEVSFFNPEFPLSKWSGLTDFTPLEILGRITARVERVWVE